MTSAIVRRMYDEMESDRGAYPAFCTYFLMACCGAMFIWQSLTTTPVQIGLPFYQESVEIWRGNYWGLIVSFFLHASLLHVGMNLYWIWRLAPQVEEVIGWYWFLLFWAIATALSTLAELCVSDETPIGASGLVYALFGYRLIAGRVLPVLEMDMGTIQSFIVWFFICLGLTYSGILPITNGAQGGGFLVGCLIAYGFIDREERWAHLLTIFVLICLFIPCYYAPWSSNWNLAQAMNSFDKHNYTQSLSFLDKSYNKYRSAEVLWLRERCYLGLGKVSDAADCLRVELTEVDPKQLSNPAELKNEYAWLLATAPDDKLRKGDEAVLYAEQACEETSYQDPEMVDTLAAAEATDGHFDEAVKWEQKAIDLEKNVSELDDLKGHLKLFQDKKVLIDHGFDTK